MKNVEKAIEISDAKISFVSLVNKAANKKRFLIAKAENGQANFATYGRIVKTNVATHHITGIVYEPLVEDAHGNYMTEEEITKAAHYFAKNSNSVDIQHSFEALKDAYVVENWVAKADFAIGDEAITKGTWLMTVEIADEAVWEAIQKGDITGFSMGGIGHYSEEDIDLSEVEKNETSKPETDEHRKKGVFKALAGLLGFDVVEKGKFTERVNDENTVSMFWNALNTLQDTLYRFDPLTGKLGVERNEETVRNVLSEFSEAILGLLSTKTDIADSLASTMPVTKAGKKMSDSNKQRLKSICEELSSFFAEFGADDEKDKEDIEVKKSEIETVIVEAVAKALTPAREPATQEAAKVAEPVTQETVEKMVADAVAKALEPKEEPITAEAVQEMVAKAVAAAVEPIAKSTGVPGNLNDGVGNTVKKSEEHFLKGLL